MKLSLLSLLALSSSLLAGPFGAEQLLPTPQDSVEWIGADPMVTHLHAAHVNSESGVELIGISSSQDQTFWMDVSAASPQAHLVADNIKGPSATCSVDADLDGDLDLIVASRWETKLNLYINDGNGSFSSATTIASAIDTAVSLKAVQIDGSGGIDIVGISDFDQQVFWLKNLGNGTFDSTQVITNSLGSPEQLESADFDNNGTQDLALLDSDSGKITVLNNDGAGNFSELHQLGLGMTSFTLTKFTSDRTDVIAISATHGDLILYENNQSGGFKTPRTLHSDTFGMQLAGATKLDSDEDIDLVLSSLNQISWLSQLENLNLSDPKNISSSESGPLALCLDDLDNDGAVDLAHSSLYDSPLSLHLGFAANPYAFWLEDFNIDHQTPILGDINSNGVSNLHEYAFNIDPTSNIARNIEPSTGTSGLPAGVSNPAAQNLSIEFIRRKAATNSQLSYSVQLSQNLRDWTPADLNSAEVTSIDSTWERVRYTPAITPNAQQFLRVEVNHLAP